MFELGAASKMLDFLLRVL